MDSILIKQRCKTRSRNNASRNFLTRNRNKYCQNNYRNHHNNHHNHVNNNTGNGNRKLKNKSNQSTSILNNIPAKILKIECKCKVNNNNNINNDEDGNSSTTTTEVPEAITSNDIINNETYKKDSFTR